MKDLFPFYSIGHFINQPENATEFEITRFEEMEEPNVDDFHKHTFYEIIWVDKGKSKQIIDYTEYEIKPNSLFFISPNQLHHFEEWKPITGGSIMFTEDFFLLNDVDKNKLFEFSFLDNFYTNACILLHKKEFEEIRQIIELIFKEQRRKDKVPSITQSLLHILLAQVQRSVNSQKQPVAKKYLVLFKQFKNLLDKYYSENKTASFYARQLNVTTHHLNLISKIVTGKTSGEVVRARSILEAKRFLTFTESSVSEIAASLNYFDSSYFAKLFKMETGIAPLDFRKLMYDKYRNK